MPRLESSIIGPPDPAQPSHPCASHPRTCSQLSVLLYPLLLGFSHALASWLHPLLLTLDGLFALDVALTFSTAVLGPSDGDPLVTHPAEIALRYARSHLASPNPKPWPWPEPWPLPVPLPSP